MIDGIDHAAHLLLPGAAISSIDAFRETRNVFAVAAPAHPRLRALAPRADDRRRADDAEEDALHRRSSTATTAGPSTGKARSSARTTTSAPSPRRASPGWAPTASPTALNLIAMLPYVSTEASGGTLHPPGGLQDLTVAAKGRLFEAGLGGGSPARLRRRLLRHAGQRLRCRPAAPLHRPCTASASPDASPRTTGRGRASSPTPPAPTPGAATSPSTGPPTSPTASCSSPTRSTCPTSSTTRCGPGSCAARGMIPISYSQQNTLGGGDIRRQDMPFVSNQMNFSKLDAMVMYTLPKPAEPRRPRSSATPTSSPGGTWASPPRCGAGLLYTIRFSASRQDRTMSTSKASRARARVVTMLVLAAAGCDKRAVDRGAPAAHAGQRRRRRRQLAHARAERSEPDRGAAARRPSTPTPTRPSSPPSRTRRRNLTDGPARHHRVLERRRRAAVEPDPARAGGSLQPAAGASRRRDLSGAGRREPVRRSRVPVLQPALRRPRLQLRERRPVRGARRRRGRTCTSTTVPRRAGSTAACRRSCRRATFPPIPPPTR